jgi:cysteine desulfurase/selenocysteine lyase
MTTSNFNPGLGFPDLETITALANQFFKTGPGAGLPVQEAVPNQNVGPAVASPFSVPGTPSLAQTNFEVQPRLDGQDFGFITDFTAPLVPDGGVGAGVPAASSPAILPTNSQLESVISSLAPDLGFGLAVSDFTAPFGDSGTAGSAPAFGSAAAPASQGFAPQMFSGVTAAAQHKSLGDIRREFPILNERVNGKRLIWLDNAATTQKPKQVIDRISYFYEHENSNIHRAAHTLAARATDAYEHAREAARRFINARSTDEIVFVRGTTEGINLIAKTWGEANVGEGDEILVSHLEHHANIVPWQQLAAKVGAKLVVAPVDDSGQIIVGEFSRLISSRTKLVSFTQVSNALGTVTPSADLIRIAHSKGVPVLLDGAQSVSHMRADVQALDADFFVFSGHKVYGPTGIGVVYGKETILDSMEPWQGGGNMIVDVTFEKTVYHGAPARFEAGTGNIADAVGLGAAIEYVESIGIERIAAHEHFLLEAATEGLSAIPGLKIIGTAREKAGVISFTLDGYKTEEVGAALDREGIAVRSGHHCAQPILRRFGVETTVRPSFAIYNTIEDVQELVRAVYALTKR